jgi:GntR family transcriptional regulator/MocR family aminotransferase
MSLLDRIETELAGIEPRHDLARLYQLCRFAQYLAVMRAPFSGQQRQQREHAGIARRAKRQRRKRMRAPAERKSVAALQGLDHTSNVFYVGTFSKSMFTDVRVGYVIVPESLVDVFETAQRHSGQIVSAPLQNALAEFIEDGHFAAHIRKMTRVYRGRRDRLVLALSAATRHTLKIAPPAGGMQLLVQIDSRHNDVELADYLAKAGVTARPLSRHFTGEITGHGLFLGFAAWTEREIDAGADLIGRVVRKLSFTN